LSPAVVAVPVLGLVGELVWPDPPWPLGEELALLLHAPTTSIRAKASSITADRVTGMRCTVEDRIREVRREVTVPVLSSSPTDVHVRPGALPGDSRVHL
jgi:hypothetical protein